MVPICHLAPHIPQLLAVKQLALISRNAELRHVTLGTHSAARSHWKNLLWFCSPALKLPKSRKESWEITSLSQASCFLVLNGED